MSTAIFQVEVDPSVVMMKHSNHFLCCGDGHGKVSFNPFTPGGAIWPKDKHHKRYIFRGLSTKYCKCSNDNFLIIVTAFTYLTMLPPENCRVIWVLIAK